MLAILGLSTAVAGAQVVKLEPKVPLAPTFADRLLR